MNKYFIMGLISFFCMINQSEAATPDKHQRAASAHRQTKDLAKKEGLPYIPTADELIAWEERTVKIINDIRIKNGLPPLKIWDGLSKCAKRHSTNMANNTVEFGHEGFQDRGDEMNYQGWLEDFGENVAFTYNYSDPVKEAILGWMESPGHRQNVLGDYYSETGIGIVYSEDGICYVTQLFAKRLYY